MQSWILTSNLWFLNTHDTHRANSYADRWTMLMKANLVWKNNNLFYSEFTLSAIDHLANRQDKMFTFTSHTSTCQFFCLARAAWLALTPPAWWSPSSPSIWWASPSPASSSSSSSSYRSVTFYLSYRISDILGCDSW